MANQIANTSKHIALLRTALRKIKADDGSNKYRFYLLNNRAKKNALLHIDPTPGKSTGSVKNPKSIRSHLSKTMSDPFEDALRTLLEISDRETDITPRDFKRLTSCAGEVVWTDDEVLQFAVTQTSGKAKAADLKRALKMPGIKKLLPSQVAVDGESLDAAAVDEDDAAPVNIQALQKLLAASPGMTDQELDDFFVEHGVSVGDLLDEEGKNPVIDDYLSRLDLIFEDDAGFDASMESLGGFVSELTSAGDGLEDSDPELGLAFAKGGLEQEIAAIEAQLAAGSGDAAKLSAALAVLDERLLALSFGTEDALQARLASLKDVHVVAASTSPQSATATGVEEDDRPVQDIVLPVDREVTPSSDFYDVVQQAQKMNKQFMGVATSSSEGMRVKDLGDGNMSEALVALPDGTMAKALDAQQLSQVEALTAENIKIIDDIMNRITNTVGADNAESKANQKKLRTVIEKANRDTLIQENPDHGIPYIRDTYRFKTVISDFRDVTRIFKIMLDMDIGLVKIDTSKLFNPKDWGWRIIAFDLRMKNGQIIEWYLPLQELEKQKKGGSGHHIFEDFRDMPADQLKNSPEAAAAMRKSREGYNEAFVRDLQRMNFSSIEAARKAWQAEEQKIRAEAAKKAAEIRVEVVN